MPDNKDKMPLVSVVTIVLNGEKYLEKSILSLKNQDYQNIEHIVMDGGSTDGTLDILKKYESTYNLKWYSGKDNGAVDAVSKGFDLARGDIFCWLDADNAYLSGAVKKIAEIFQQHPEIDFVFGDTLLLDKDDKIIGRTRHVDFDIDIFLYLGMNINPQSAFWRRSLHEKMNGMDRQYRICSDWDFFLRMAMSGAEFYHVRSFLSCYRYHPTQQTKTKETMRTEGEKIFKKFVPNISEKNLRRRRKIALAKKAMKFILQGDILYLFEKICERFGIFKSAEQKARMADNKK